MKTLISIFALTLALAFTVPAFAGDVTTAKKAEEQCRAMAAIGMLRPRRVQENIEVPIAAGR